MKTKNEITLWEATAEICRFDSLNEKIRFTLAEACEGVIAFGATGSGKTSGTGTHIPLGMLRAGFGGLVLCAKSDEPERFRALAKSCGRESDIVMFGPGFTERYNFLNAELSGIGGGVESLIECFEQISQAISGDGQQQGDIWERAARQLLRNILDLFRISGRPIEIPDLYKAAVDQVFQDDLLRSASPSDPRDQRDLVTIRAYLQQEFRNMGDKTKASVLMQLTSCLDPFLRGSMRELFCTTTTISPMDCRKGKIIVVNLPLKTYKKLGQAAAVAWKFAFQRTIEGFFGKEGQTAADQTTRPVFLFADECQYFMSSYDSVFQTTARSSRACTVYLTQNVPNLWLAGGRKAKDSTASLLGNLQTKILHQNSCPETYKWFTEVLGRELQDRAGRSASFHGEGGGGANTSISRDVQLDARDFQVLAKGGKPFRFCTTAILQQGGKTYRGGKLWSQIAFQQQREGKR